MNSDIDANSDAPTSPRDSVADATSELNDLLQIISGTGSSIGEACQGNENTQAGGAEERVLTIPKLGDFPKKNASPAVEKKQSILVVDDEQMTLALVSRILTEGGYRVKTAQSGFECLDHFRRSPHEFHLVLLDLSMPFMDGEETFNRLRDIRPDMPVIICTGFIQQERLRRLMASGLAGFLRKPVAPDEIVEHVRSILAKVKYTRVRVDPSNVSAAI